MNILIDGFQAEECARDLANDARDLARDLVAMRDNIAEFSASDLESFNMKLDQLRSLMQLQVTCKITGAVYTVGDYITKRRELLSSRRKMGVELGYQRFIKNLH